MAKDNYCIYCGFKLFPEDHFCPHCGKKLDEVEAPKKTSIYEPIKVMNPNDTAKSTNPDYEFYKKRVKDLKDTYEKREAKVIELIEKKFPNGQLSYARFRGEVDNCRVNFYKEADAAENMISLSDEYSDKIADALKEKVNTLQEIIGKMNDLQSELIISISNGDEDSNQEIEDLFNDMNQLIDSIKDYE